MLTLDELIETAEEFIRIHCSTVTPETPQFTVHRVPPGLDDEDARKWLESLPGIQLVEHTDRTENSVVPFRQPGRRGDGLR